MAKGRLRGPGVQRREQRVDGASILRHSSLASTCPSRSAHAVRSRPASCSAPGRRSGSGRRPCGSVGRPATAGAPSRRKSWRWRRRAPASASRSTARRPGYDEGDPVADGGIGGGHQGERPADAGAEQPAAAGVDARLRDQPPVRQGDALDVLWIEAQVPHGGRPVEEGGEAGTRQGLPVAAAPGDGRRQKARRRDRRRCRDAGRRRPADRGRPPSRHQGSGGAPARPAASSSPS